MSKELANKLVDRLKQRVTGLTVDPVIEFGFDKVLDWLIDIGIGVLQQMKGEAAKKRAEKKKDTDLSTKKDVVSNSSESEKEPDTNADY